GLLSERAGIVNIGLEGLIIIGTVTGSCGAYYFGTKLGWGVPAGPIMGLLLGLACGAAFASIHALATVTFKIDHIVSGVVINLVAVGLARFLSTVFFGQATQSDPGQPHLHVISIPLLSSIPAFGTAFQGLSPFVLFPFLIGFAHAIPLALRDWPIIRSIPEQFVNMTPYLVTIVVRAGFIGRVRPPAAAGKAYEGTTT